MVDIVGVATLDADVNRLMRKGSVARSMVPPQDFSALAQSFDGKRDDFHLILDPPACRNRKKLRIWHRRDRFDNGIAKPPGKALPQLCSWRWVAAGRPAAQARSVANALWPKLTRAQSAV